MMSAGEAGAGLFYDEGIFKLQPSLLEQTFLTVTLTDVTDLRVLWLYLSNLTQVTTIRVYFWNNVTKSYQLVNSTIWPTNFVAGTLVVPIQLQPHRYGFRVTLQSAVAEAAVRNVPWNYVQGNPVPVVI